MAYTTINKGSSYFNTKLYTGNGSTQSITGVGFQPDWVWIKMRSSAEDHVLFDAVRGVTKILESNTTDAEETNLDSLTSFDSDGFTTGSLNRSNANGSTYASWNWKANGAGVSNTAGTISSTVSANTTAGFSIVSYTGTGATATVGHGLGVAPSMIIVKQRDTTRDWVVGHNGIGWTKYLYLNSTQASAVGNFFNDTNPSSTVFNVVNDGGVNASGGSYIAYCFAEVKGYSKFGSYTGNNNNDGPFIYTGFKPAFFLTKATTQAQWWTLLDNKRDSYNVATLGISPNSSNSESTFNTDRGPHNMDFLSNGLKMRTDSSGVNGTNSFIYMAFAENPFVSSTLIPTTAR